MSDITYRTNDDTRWGSGQGSDLSAAQIDINFFTLAGAIQALQDHALTNENQIDYFSVTGDQLFIVLADHTTFGPYVLPTAQWNFIEGGWQPNTNYSAFDVFAENGAIYLVLVDHTSAATFNAGANDGEGHNYYGLLLAAPEDELPTGGTVGQKLVVTAAGGANIPTTGWQSDTRVLGFFIEGAADSDEVLLRYVVPETMTFPVSLTGSYASAEFPGTTDQAFGIYQGDTLVGTVNFASSPDTGTFDFATAITFAPGDILTITASSDADPHLQNISFSLVATLP